MIYLYVIGSMAVIDFVMERNVVSRSQSILAHELAQQANTLQARLEGELQSKIMMMRSLAAATSVHPDMTEAQFHTLVAQATSGAPTLSHIADAPDLRLRHVYPADQTEPAKQWSQARDAEGAPAAFRALETGDTFVEGLVPLPNGRNGFVLTSPVMSPQSQTGPVWGTLQLTLDGPTFFEHTGLSKAQSVMDIAVRRVDPAVSAQSPLFGAQSLFSQTPVLLRIDLPIGHWELAVGPKNGWPTYAAERQNLRFWLLLVTVFLLLISAYFIELNRRKTNAEQNLLSAINAISDGFALYDEDDRLVLYNQQYQRLYGPSADLLSRGRRFEDIIRDGVSRGRYPQAQGQEEAWIQDRLNAHKDANYEFEQLLADGTWLRVAERKTQNGWTVGVRVDITELKQAQIGAEAASEAKTEFLNIISHELRTPLTVILGYNAFLAAPQNLPATRALQTALQDTATEQNQLTEKTQTLLDTVARYAEKMDASGKHLLNLIQETLDYSKIEEGKMSLHPEPMPVRGLIEDIVDQFQQQADSKSIELWAEVDDVAILADETRLKQVLINLVGNAVKFTDAGEIAIQTETSGTDLTFHVTDTGFGVPAAQLDKIFESFHQVENPDVRRAGGTGLGLAITKKLVVMHGGDIWVTSTEGKGSRFSFTIPLA
ncbi:MAG: PAS-domain containing protein [Thalassovita sp.]